MRRTKKIGNENTNKNILQQENKSVQDNYEDTFKQTAKPEYEKYFSGLSQLLKKVNYGNNEVCQRDFSSTHALVTAVSSNHVFSLTHTLHHMNDRFPCETLIIYSLGMSNKEKQFFKHLRRSYSPLILIDFDYSKFPSYFNVTVAAGEYAWKPSIIREVLEYFDYVVWFDGGTQLSSPTELYPYLRNSGFFSSISSGWVRDWTHQGTLDYFNVGSFNPILMNSNCNAAYLGFYSPICLRDLVIPWFNCALDRNCIAPPGSSRDNHRQDQAALTVLVHLSSKYRCGERDFGYFSIHNDNYVTGMIGLHEVFQISVPSYLYSIAMIDKERKGSYLSDDCKLSSKQNENADGCFSPSQLMAYSLTFICEMTIPIHFLQVGGSKPDLLMEDILGKLSTITWVTEQVESLSRQPNLEENIPHISIKNWDEFYQRNDHNYILNSIFLYDITSEELQGDKLIYLLKIFNQMKSRQLWTFGCQIKVTGKYENGDQGIKETERLLNPFLESGEYTSSLRRYLLFYESNEYIFAIFSKGVNIHEIYANEGLRPI